jgi:hypothetical protein
MKSRTKNHTLDQACSTLRATWAKLGLCVVNIKFWIQNEE